MGGGVEYAHHFPAYRMRCLKRCSNDSTSTAWDYAALMCKLYSLAWRDRGMAAQNVATILKPLGPNPSQPLLHMVQHVSDWVVPFLLSQHFSPHPLNSSMFPLLSPHDDRKTSVSWTTVRLCGLGIFFRIDVAWRVSKKMDFAWNGFPFPSELTKKKIMFKNFNLF